MHIRCRAPSRKFFSGMLLSTSNYSGGTASDLNRFPFYSLLNSLSSKNLYRPYIINSSIIADILKKVCSFAKISDNLSKFVEITNKKTVYFFSFKFLSIAVSAKRLIVISSIGGLCKPARTSR